MFWEMLLTVVFACHSAATHSKWRKIVNWHCFASKMKNYTPLAIHSIRFEAVYNSASVHNFLWDKNITRSVSISQCVIHSSFCMIASFSFCPKVPQRLVLLTSAHFTILISDVFIKLSLAIFRWIRHRCALFVKRGDTHMHVWVVDSHTDTLSCTVKCFLCIYLRLSFLLRAV